MSKLPEKQRIRWGTFVFLLLISVIGGLFIWHRPVKPLWVAYEGQGFCIIHGPAPDGEIAYLESSTRLAVRDLQTGAILRAFDIPAVDRLYAVTTEDGKWILLLTEKPELLVISLEDGRLRYPPIPIQSKSFPYLRDDGRYAIISGAHQPPATVDELIDLRDGTVLWSTKSRIDFCGRYQDLVIATAPPFFFAPRLIAISDQRELGPISLPELPGRELAHIGPFTDDRIAFMFSFPSNNGNTEQKYLSARVSDKQLVDIRDEPLIFSRMEGADLNVTSTLKGQLRYKDLLETPSGRMLVKLYKIGTNIGFIKQWSSQQYSWQSTANGRPVGPPIRLENGIAWPTKDGRYLVESGDRLAVFSIPPRSRWPETLSVVAFPWLLVAAWRTVRKRRAHSPSLAGSQPVQ